MDKYYPSEAPNKEEWLELDEAIRIELIREYHDMLNHDDLEEDAKQIHAVIHAVVENQIALGVEPVPGTVARLQRQGLSRHDAIHAVGAVLSDGLFKVMQGDGTEFELKKYRHRLDKLTAKRWKKGQI